MVVSRYTHPASVISTLLEETTLLFGWTDSNDRRENVWMLISSICIPSLFQLAPADRYRHDIIMETRWFTYSLVLQRRHICSFDLGTFVEVVYLVQLQSRTESKIISLRRLDILAEGLQASE